MVSCVALLLLLAYHFRVVGTQSIANVNVLQENVGQENTLKIERNVCARVWRCTHNHTARNTILSCRLGCLESLEKFNYRVFLPFAEPSLAYSFSPNFDLVPVVHGVRHASVYVFIIYIDGCCCFTPAHDRCICSIGYRALRFDFVFVDSIPIAGIFEWSPAIDQSTENNTNRFDLATVNSIFHHVQSS